MPKAPKYTRTQLWIIILLVIGAPVMLITAWLRNLHLFKLAAITFAASMVFVCWSAIRKMHTDSEVFLRGWGPIYKGKNPVLWAGLSVAAWMMMLMFGWTAIAALLSLA